MRKIQYLLSAAMASAVLIVGLAFPAAVAASGGEEQITICHRTNSVKNPYVQITVDESAVDGVGQNDHTQHTGPVATSEAVAQALKDSHTNWGDIIPAFNGYSGLNWDSVGQAVLEGGCLGGNEIEEVVPAAVTFIQPTCDKLGSYTIPTTENVEYKINGEVVAAGTYTAQNGTTVTVTAEALEGYYIGDETTDTWTNTFTAPNNCGQVLGTTTTAQVAAPVSGVKAGAGGADATSIASLLGLGGSLGATSLGLAVRKRKN